MKRSFLLALLLAATAALVTPATAQPRAATTISAVVSPTRLVVGQGAAVNGKVTPAKATPTVYLQRKVDGRWVDRGSAPVNRTTGAYRLTLHPSQVGSYALRVRSAGGSVVSRTVSVEVWSTKRVVSGSGTKQVPGVFLSGGTYTVFAAYGGNCRYSSQIIGIPGDIRSNIILPSAPFQMTVRMVIRDVPRHDYTLHVTADGSSCPWEITFFKA